MRWHEIDSSFSVLIVAAVDGLRTGRRSQLPMNELDKCGDRTVRKLSHSDDGRLLPD
jgi:hypothetical protein